MKRTKEKGSKDRHLCTFHYIRECFSTNKMSIMGLFWQTLLPNKKLHEIPFFRTPLHRKWYHRPLLSHFTVHWVKTCCHSEISYTRLCFDVFIAGKDNWDFMSARTNWFRLNKLNKLQLIMKWIAIKLLKTYWTKGAFLLFYCYILVLVVFYPWKYLQIHQHCAFFKIFYFSDSSTCLSLHKERYISVLIAPGSVQHFLFLPAAVKSEEQSCWQ